MRFFRLLCLLVFVCVAPAKILFAETKQEISYLPIGDSYTIGEGATPIQSWPILLAKHLRASGLNVKLLANPARTGWTAQNAIDYELPVFEKIKPQFTTLLIGVNDWVQEVGKETFRANLEMLLDKMLALLSSKDHLLVITIPDFSVTPMGERFSRGRDISSGIWEFNNIIKEEAQNRKLTVVDIFSLSQGMKYDPALVAADGLHPSAKEYALWAELIYPAAHEILSREPPQP